MQVAPQAFWPRARLPGCHKSSSPHPLEDMGRKLISRVLTHAGSADVAFRTPRAPYEKSKFLGSGGSMVARLKLKGIDGTAPPGVEPAA
ncbi:hypothetical protein YC2023_108244 [Brassica napus]